MSYNLTDIGAVNNSIEFIQNINTQIMGGHYGTLILITISVIIYMAFVFSSRQPVKSLVATAFISFGLSLFLVTVELISPLAVWICLVAAGIGLAFWNTD